MNVATSTGSSALFVSSSGQVGVGTASPGNLLHVYGGNIQLGSTGTASILNSVTGNDFGNLTLQSGYQGTSSAPRINIPHVKSTIITGRPYKNFTLDHFLLSERILL